MKKTFYIKFFPVALALVAMFFVTDTALSSDIMAQTENVPVNAGIDGGLAILLLSGLAYAAKKLYDGKDNNEFKKIFD